MDVLVIEDDPAIGESLRRGFLEAEHNCEWISRGDEGLSRAQSRQFDVIVLDLMLPGESGMDILRALRQQGMRTPLIILTARASVEDRVEGLKAGADDYVVKPFAFPELLARVEAVCRRTVDRPSPVLTVGPLTLDLTTRTVRRGDVEVDLTPTEFSLLEFLMRHAGQVVTRRMICEHLWESDWEGTTNVIEVHVNRLRNKLARGFEEALIETVRGRGYAIRSI